ncbi:hypothetical protein MHK_004676, partial [Candidatus Magnetomorum sp. HK-1]
LQFCKSVNYFSDNMKDANIIHIATHGIFAGKKNESFLLTYDSKLTIDKLESLVGYSKDQNHTVDLLTLSACQTALGNERAALGLAGVAVKAGIKSVVATFWYVDDEATSLAIREFYKQLLKPGLSKAKALQNKNISEIGVKALNDYLIEFQLMYAASYFPGMTTMEPQFNNFSIMAFIFRLNLFDGKLKKLKE